MSPETLNDRQSEAPEQPPVSGAPGQEAVPGAVPDQAQSNFDWFSRGPDGGGNAAPEAPTAQVQPESTAEQRDAQVRYSDAELLGNRYAVHLKVQGAGNRAVKAWQGMKARVRNAFDAPGKTIKKFALDRAQKGFDSKSKRLDAATSERAKQYHQRKLDKAADKLIKREVSHNTRVKRMEARTQAVHENAERRRQNYIDKLKLKKGDKLAEKALHKQLREEKVSWYSSRKIAAETLEELKQRPEQRKQLGDVVMDYAVSHRYENAARRGYRRADRSRQRTVRNIERTNENIASYTNERQDAQKAAETARKHMEEAKGRVADLQARLGAEAPGTPRYDVLAAALGEAQEQAASHEAEFTQQSARATVSHNGALYEKVRHNDLNTQYAERNARATTAHEDVNTRRDASRQHKAALDQEVTVALNPSRR